MKQFFYSYEKNYALLMISTNESLLPLTTFLQNILPLSFSRG